MKNDRIKLLTTLVALSSAAACGGEEYVAPQECIDAEKVIKDFSHVNTKGILVKVNENYSYPEKDMLNLTVSISSKDWAFRNSGETAVFNPKYPYYISLGILELKSDGVDNPVEVLKRYDVSAFNVPIWGDPRVGKEYTHNYKDSNGTEHSLGYALRTMAKGGCDRELKKWKFDEYAF